MHLTVMGVHDRLDDREAQTCATAAAVASSLRAPEALEHSISSVRRQPGAVIAYLERRVTALVYASSSIGESGGVWISTLLVRFASTCLIWSGSASTIAWPSAARWTSLVGATARVSCAACSAELAQIDRNPSFLRQLVEARELQ